MQQITAGAREFAGAGVGRIQIIDERELGLKVQAIVENLFDCAVARRIEGQRACARGFQSSGAKLLCKADDALYRPKVVQNTMREQTLDQPLASRTNGCRLRKAPLWITHFKCIGIWRHMLIDCVTATWFSKTWMHCNHLKIMINTHG